LTIEATFVASPSRNAGQNVAIRTQQSAFMRAYETGARDL